MAGDRNLRVSAFFLFIGSMEKYSFFNVGHRRSRVIKVSMEYILHKCRGMLNTVITVILKLESKRSRRSTTAAKR